MTEYAGVLHRILAAVIDHALLAIITMVIALPFGVSGAFMMMGADPIAAMAAAASWMTFIVISAIIWLVYFPYFESTTGQTLGKKLMGIKVVREDGKKLALPDAIIRTVLRIVDALPFAYIIGLIVVLVSQKKQRIGDMAARTIVVKA